MFFRKITNSANRAKDSILEGATSFAKTKTGENTTRYFCKTARGVITGAKIGGVIGLVLSPAVIADTFRDQDSIDKPINLDRKGRAIIPSKNITHETTKKAIANAVNGTAGMAYIGAFIGGWRVTLPYTLFKITSEYNKKMTHRDKATNSSTTEDKKQRPGIA